MRYKVIDQTNDINIEGSKLASSTHLQSRPALQAHRPHSVFHIFVLSDGNWYRSKVGDLVKWVENIFVARRSCRISYTNPTRGSSHTFVNLNCLSEASVCQSHAMGVVHGDLKTENFFVTSWLHLFVSDFAGFKPATLPVDDPAEFSFFFEGDLQRRRCYLAPERFEEANTEGDRRSTPLFEESFSTRLASADVFSLGCVLAELFLGGTALFDLPQLLAYRAQGVATARSSNTSGSSDWPNEALQRIQPPAARELIKDMIQRDPTKRKTITQYLRLWCEKVFPPCFRTCLFPLFATLLHPIYQQPDARVLLIHHNLENIICAIVGPQQVKKRLGKYDDWRIVVKEHVRTSISKEIADPITTEQILGPIYAGSNEFPHPQLRASCGARFSQQMLSAWEHAAIAASAPTPHGTSKTPPQSFSASAAATFATLFENNAAENEDGMLSDEQSRADDDASDGLYEPEALSIVH
tara:strand:- start:46 stop:1449 length:1404 start_codon:yes stop_codon:yes gene_type:complete